MASAETRRKISERMKGRVFSQEHKENLSNSLKRKFADPKVRARISEGHKHSWANGNRNKDDFINNIIPLGRAKKKVNGCSLEYRKKLSEASIRMYATQGKSIGYSPNKSEIKLGVILESLFPNEWKFVGDGYTWIAGKNPDFLNINGKKKLIELFGDYWHCGEDGNNRISHFANYGFKTLIIWEHELKNNESLKAKLGEFCG